MLKLIVAIFCYVNVYIFLCEYIIIMQNTISVKFVCSQEELKLSRTLAFQISGLCCSIAGFVFAVFSVQFDHFRFTHGILGLIIMILGILQPINAVL